MNSRTLTLAVFALSIAVIGGALIFQYAVGLVPCELCLAERWPWYAAILLSGLLLVWRLPGRAVPVLFGLVFLGSAALAFFHVGVEQHVFPGPEACAATKLTGGSLEDLKRQLMATPVVRCDQVQWSLFGVSLAGFNLLASLVIVGLAAIAWRGRY